MDKFKFALGASVKLRCSEETGTVIGRAEYTNREPAYWVLYKAGDGRQVENWWDESAIAG